jgi:hypothetical protein
MIPSSWDWQKKAKILQAYLQSFCFTLPHSRSECTLVAPLAGARVETTRLTPQCQQPCVAPPKPSSRKHWIDGHPCAGIFEALYQILIDAIRPWPVHDR